MLLLRATGLPQAKTDNAYLLKHYRQVLDERNDFSEQLSRTFEELLSILGKDAKQDDTSESHWNLVS